jgi:hypothetical protein
MIIDLGDKGTKDVFSNDQCHRCRLKFILNKFIVQDGLFTFHLTCFKKYKEEKIEQHQNSIYVMQSELEKLKPYNKEMICETLLKEKYG